MVDAPIKEPINKVELWSQMIVGACHLHNESLCHYNLIWQRWSCPLGRCLAKSSSIILNWCQARLLSANYFTSFLCGLCSQPQGFGLWTLNSQKLFGEEHLLKNYSHYGLMPYGLKGWQRCWAASCSLDWNIYMRSNNKTAYFRVCVLCNWALMQLGNIDSPYCNYVNNTNFNTPFIFHFHVHTEGEG